MVLTLALFTLFALTAVTVGAVLADSALRGWISYCELSRVLKAGKSKSPQVRLVQHYELGTLPACRSSRLARPAVLRPAPRTTRNRAIAAA